MYTLKAVTLLRFWTLEHLYYTQCAHGLLQLFTCSGIVELTDHTVHFIVHNKEGVVLNSAQGGWVFSYPKPKSNYER